MDNENQNIKVRNRMADTESDMLVAVNNISTLMLEPDSTRFEENIMKSLSLMAHAVKVDRVYIWKNDTIDGDLYCSQIYEWSENAEAQQGNEYTINVSYNEMAPGMENILKNDNCINGIVKDMPQAYQDQLLPQGIVSIIIVPVFLYDELWGFVGFDDCHKERIFSKNEELILRSASKLITNALMRQSISQDLKKALVQAEAASTAKGNFLSAMSHEMRTPMNAILGMTAIGKKSEDAEDKNNALDKISEAAAHLLGIINDVLDMAQIEEDKLELVNTDFNFNRMLYKVLDIINFRAVEKNQTIHLNSDGKIPDVLHADEQRLIQVLTNLLSNAVKFSPCNTDILLNAILVKEDSEFCDLRFEVIDDGIGISQEQQEVLFKVFEQLRSGMSREYGGIGLGLAISKSIVESMDGKIWVESESGKGAKFIFTVTVKHGTKSFNNILSSDSLNAGLGLIMDNTAQNDNAYINFKDKKLLHVEDIEINREILKEILIDTGIQIDFAENGNEALEMMRNDPGKYDIIFMDIQMPEMDGYEATRRIRALPYPEAKDIPIVALTANVFNDDIKACYEAGMNGHLSKPMDLYNILEVLRKYLFN